MSCPCSSSPNLPQPCPQPDSDCGSCQPCKSTAKICHFVVETLEEARRYKNSYVVVTGENNAVYHIGEDGNPLTVNRPMVFEAHVPAVNTYKSTLVFDFVGGKAYVYDPTGNFKQWSIV